MVGDTASLDQDGKPLPGVAQVAMQQGRYAGKLIRRRITGQTDSRAVSLFRQGQHGGGRQRLRRAAKRAVSNQRIPRVARMGGVHLQFLAQSSLRVSVFVQWVWTYLTGQRGSRLIVNHHGADHR